VLDANGRPLDALPGLYSAAVFTAQLNGALALAAEKPTDARLREWHAAAASKIHSTPARQFYGERFAPQVLDVIRAKGGVAAADPAPAPLARPARPNARAAGQLALSKSAVEMPVVDALTRLQYTIAQDTLQNEENFHRQIHQWFAAGEPTVRTFAALNERVYAELFLTPRSDPWLGLAPADAYAALENEGLAARP
jgi:hypothetical protein